MTNKEWRDGFSKLAQLEARLGVRLLTDQMLFQMLNPIDAQKLYGQLLFAEMFAKRHLG